MEGIMKKSTTILALVMALALSGGTLSACGNESKADASGKGHVYYHSMKVEQVGQYKQLAKRFTKKTGITVDITSASSDQYEQSLKGELAKSKAPTLFDVDNNNFPNWTSYYDDMSDTNPYKDLTKKEFALKSEGKVSAVPFIMERYGLIYNKALLKKYFDSSWSTIKSVDKINNFKALKTVADEIQEHKNDLGVSGAFTSAGFDPSSMHRFSDQTAHIPVYYEYKDQKTDTIPAKISGKYMPNFKNIFDLYLKDATVAPTQLAGATMEDAYSDFNLKKAVFIQTGTWAYKQLRGQGVADEDMGVLPIYIGTKGEEKEGLTVSFEYWAMNKNAPDKDKKATKEWMDYILNDNDARKYTSEEMGFETPFKSYAKAGFKTANPIHRANDAYAKAGNYDVVIYPLPSQQWVSTLGNAMLEYAQGTKDWGNVKTAFVDGWSSEYKITH